MLIIRHNLFIFDNNYLHQWLFIIILIIIFISLFLFNCQFEYKRQHRFLFENSFIAFINSTLKCILALIIILRKVIIRHPTFTLNIVHACVSSWRVLAKNFCCDLAQNGWSCFSHYDIYKWCSMTTLQKPITFLAILLTLISKWFRENLSSWYHCFSIDMFKFHWYFYF